MTTYDDILATEPSEIEPRSMATIDAEAPDPLPVTGREWEVLRRMIHTTADFELAELVRFHPKAITAGVQALGSGCRVFTDTEMARKGIPLRRMGPLGCSVLCRINDSATLELAEKHNYTRAGAAMLAAGQELNNAVVVIGNAPTALAMVLKRMHEEDIRPALVVGMPVGFIKAAESKELLSAQQLVPFITIQGRKGGSALAACVVNALANMALADKEVD